MKNIAITIAYDGTAFKGWQKTKMGPSVEATLQVALSQVLSSAPELQAASRTDAGVHAEGQVVNFFIPEEAHLGSLLKSLRALLPKTVAVLSIREMATDFHPTLSATSKEYHYTLCLGPVQLPMHRTSSWHVPYPLDLANMQTAIKHFYGRHDFSSFCNQRKDLRYENKERTIYSLKLHELENSRLQIRIQGDHFLYKMVRNIVGTLVYVGLGKLNADSIPALIAAQDRSLAGITAPSHGLTLKRIFYPDTIDPNAMELRQ